jgi:hypothetical protein
MKTILINVSFTLFFLLLVTNVFSQDTIKTSKGTLTVTADLVSKYVWRGQNWAGSGPHIQPTFSYAIKGFEIGAMGSYGVSNNYQEVDPYLKYTTHGFSFQITDYYIPYTFTGDNASGDPRIFNFKSKTTASTGELAISYKGPESFPISLLAGTIIYGNDHSYGYKSSLDKDSSIYYSTYIELGYTIKAGGQNLDLFAGLTPGAGFYGNSFGFVNLGLKGYRNIQITDKYALPVYATFVVNPQAEKLYLVFGITF